MEGATLAPKFDDHSKMNLAELKFDEHGLIPVVIQDVVNSEVLMVAYMNKEAITETLKTRRATFFSRSRQKLWIKGESSGHTQEVKEIYFDCDNDTILIKVKQNVAACHEGFRSCFFKKLEGDILKTVGTRLFDPSKAYGR